MIIAGIQKTTLADYPGKVAATLFTRGCNFRCPYCHNPELVIPNQFAEKMHDDMIWQFLESRRNKLEGVCITGGEPTLHADLSIFLHRIKQLGFLVKLDTNGTNPERVSELINEGLVDYIAMDIKGPAEKYQEVANSTAHNNTDLLAVIQKSIALLMGSGIDYEFRTTIMKPLLGLSDIKGIGALINGAKQYYLQNYVSSKQVDPTQEFSPFTKQELIEAQIIMQNFVTHVGIR